jgi:hypothetical protein
MSSTVVFSQDFGMGPKFKNSSPGKIAGPRIALVHDSNPSTLKGPEAKNTPVWKQKTDKKFKVGFRDEINNPQGLQAKNSNPWDKPKAKADTKASFVEPKSMRPKRSWLH